MALAFVLSLIIAALVMTMMALGVLVGRRPLEGECKAFERLADDRGLPLCAACEEVEDCPLKKSGLVRTGPSPGTRRAVPEASKPAA